MTKLTDLRAGAGRGDARAELPHDPSPHSIRACGPFVLWQPAIARLEAGDHTPSFATVTLEWPWPGNEEPGSRPRLSAGP